MKLKNKLLSLVLPAVLALTIVSGMSFSDDYGSYRLATKTNELVRLAAAAGALAHELQKERGMSAGFLGSEGRLYRDALREQRLRTDHSYKTQIPNRNSDAYALEVRKPFSTTIKVLGGLPELRKRVDAREITVNEELRLYSHLIDSLLSLVALTGVHAGEVKIAHRLSSYHDLTRLKEASGLERAVLNSTFVRGVFAPGMYHRAVRLGEQQRVYQELFLHSAADTDRLTLNEFLQDPVVNQVTEIRKRSLESQNKTTVSTPASVWWELSTRRIDMLKDIENIVAAGVLGAADEARDRMLLQIFVFVVLLGVVFVVTAYFSVYLIGDLLRTITKTVAAAEDIARGNVAVRLTGTDQRRDELGHLMDSINKMAENLGLILVRVQSTAAGSLDNAENLNTTTNNLNESAQELTATAEETSASIEELLSSIEGLQKGVTEGAERTNHMSERVERLRTSSADFLEDMEKLESSVSAVSQLTEEGRLAIGESSQSMEAIREGSAKIHEIIDVISSISEQINLLALNASIGAARAGDAGRGFAVVADEVSRLATRTSQSVKSVAELAVTSHKDVEQGYSRVTQTMRVFLEIGERIGDIASFAQRTHASSIARREDIATIAENSRQLSQFASEIRRTTEEQRSATAEIGAGSENLTQHSQTLLNAARISGEMTTTIRRESEDLLALANQFNTVENSSKNDLHVTQS